MRTTRKADIAQMEQVITEVRATLPDYVVDVRHQFMNDQSGDPAVYVDIVLKDEALANPNLRDELNEIKFLIYDRLNELETETVNYVHLRSSSGVKKEEEEKRMKAARRQQSRQLADQR